MRRVKGDFRGVERRPYIRVLVLLPRLGVSAYMNLLVDTGADFTSIHWTDRERLCDTARNALPPNTDFQRKGVASGISGTSIQYGIEEARIFFVAENSHVQAEAVDVRIALSNASAGVPSLLGRDILSAARLDFDMAADRLALEWPA